MKISTSKYKTAVPEGRVTFAHPWQDRIHPALSGRIAYLALVKGKLVACNSGFRSDEEQVVAQRAALEAHPYYYQTADGGVWKPVSGGKDQRMAAPVGQSNHGYGLAVDSDGTWLEEMSSSALLPYGLWKPMSYEPWHVEPVETKGMSWDTKKTEFYEYMGGGYYPMDVKSFQMIVGLKPDGIAGTQTKAKAAEVNAVAKSILAIGTVVKTGAEAVQWLADNKVITGPDYWIGQMKVVKNLDLLLIKIVNEMKG